MTKKAEQPEQPEFPTMVFMPIKGAWRKYLWDLEPENGDGGAVMTGIWLFPEGETRDHETVQCRVSGGRLDGRLIVCARSLLNHLPYERLPDNGVSDDG